MRRSAEFVYWAGWGFIIACMLLSRMWPSLKAAYHRPRAVRTLAHALEYLSIDPDPPYTNRIAIQILLAKIVEVRRDA